MKDKKQLEQILAHDIETLYSLEYRLFEAYQGIAPFKVKEADLHIISEIIDTLIEMGLVEVK